MSMKGHAHESSSKISVSVAVITVSDSRNSSDDKSGAAIIRLLEEEGHTLAWRTLVRDEPAEILAALRMAVDGKHARAVVYTGGTGLAPRDQTVEALEPHFEKSLPGFGELFRMLSFQEIGAAGMLSRCCAGTYKGAIVFALPGSTKACELAMKQLILPELRHIVGLI